MDNAPTRGRAQREHLFDFATLERTQSGGNRVEESSCLTPMAWPEYLEWFTSKCPSYQRS